MDLDATDREIEAKLERIFGGNVLKSLVVHFTCTAPTADNTPVANIVQLIKDIRNVIYMQ